MGEAGLIAKEYETEFKNKDRFYVPINQAIDVITAFKEINEEIRKNGIPTIEDDNKEPILEGRPEAFNLSTPGTFVTDPEKLNDIKIRYDVFIINDEIADNVIKNLAIFLDSRRKTAPHIDSYPGI